MIAQMMEQCWEKEPQNRPTFPQISERFTSETANFEVATPQKLSSARLVRLEQENKILKEKIRQLESERSNKKIEKEEPFLELESTYVEGDDYGSTSSWK